MTINKYYIHIFIALWALLLFCSATPVLAENNDAKKAIEKPTLNNLYPGWWAYIEEKPEESEARLLTLVDKDSLSIVSEKTELYLQQINNRIQVWNKLKQEISKPYQTIKYKDAYSLNELLLVISEIRQEHIQLNKNKQLFEERKKFYKNSDALIDRITAQYIQIDKKSNDRPQAALAIISQKIKSEILVQDLRLLKEKIKLAEQQINDLDKHIVYIQKNLSVGQDEKSLENNIEQAKKSLKTARNNLLNNELKYDYANNTGTNQFMENVLLFLSKVNVFENELDVILASMSLDLKNSESIKKIGNKKDAKSIANIVYINAKKRESKFEDIDDNVALLNSEGRLLFESMLESSDKSPYFDEIRLSLNQLALLENKSKDYHTLNTILLEHGQAKSIITNNILFSVKNFWKQVVAVMGYSLFKMGDTPVTAFSLIRLLLIIFIGLKFAKNISKLVIKIGSKNANASSGIYTLSRLVQYVIISASIIIGLSSIGIDFTKLAFLAGALSIGIGFGLQSIVNNFVSGLILLFERTLRVDDVIQLGNGTVGRVKEINVRSTLVNTPDNIDLIVPNAELLNNQLTNLTLKEQHTRVHVPFGVAYGTNKELVKEAALAATENVNFVMNNREVHVWLVNFGESSLDFELVVWIDMNKVKVPGSIKPTFIWNIETELAKRSIEIPFPQRDLHLKTVNSNIAFK